MWAFPHFALLLFPFVSMCVDTRQYHSTKLDHVRDNIVHLLASHDRLHPYGPVALDCEWFLPQLCHLLMVRPAAETASLLAYLMHQCTTSLHLSVKVIWMFQSILAHVQPALAERCDRLARECEMAFVNAETQVWYNRLLAFSMKFDVDVQFSPTHAHAHHPRRIPTASSPATPEGSASTVAIATTVGTAAETVSTSDVVGVPATHVVTAVARDDAAELAAQVSDYLAKQSRSAYFNGLQDMIHFLEQTSIQLKALPHKQRNERLHALLEHASQSLMRGLYFPTGSSSAPHYRILRVVHNDARCLNSRDKVRPWAKGRVASDVSPLRMAMCVHVGCASAGVCRFRLSCGLKSNTLTYAVVTSVWIKRTRHTRSAILERWRQSRCQPRLPAVLLQLRAVFPQQSLNESQCLQSTPR
jgi:hypothetical protein